MSGRHRAEGTGIVPATYMAIFDCEGCLLGSSQFFETLAFKKLPC